MPSTFKETVLPSAVGLEAFVPAQEDSEPTVGEMRGSEVAQDHGVTRSVDTEGCIEVCPGHACLES